MQQLVSAFGLDWSLLLAQVVNFGIVLVALWYFLYKPVLKVLSERQATIAKSVADAEKAEEMFASADAEVRARMKDADTEAASVMQSARDAATAEKVRLMAEAEARATALAKDAEARAQETLERARRETEQKVARLAVLAAEKVLKDHHD